MATRPSAARPDAWAPMLATLGPPPPGENYAVEWKMDGQRGTVIVEDTVTVFSRNGADISRTFPELAGVAAAVGGRRLVLDGEIVAVDAAGRPSFTRLQRRWPQQRHPKPVLVQQVPVTFIAFDLLAIDGRDITASAYQQRRELLDTVMAVEKSKVLTVPKSWVDVSPTDMLAIAESNAVEGVISKRLDSPYQPGRSNAWVKTPVRATAELIIAGFWCASGPGGRSCIGTLLLAGHNGAGDLVAIGKVGTGFSASTRRRLFELLDPIRRATAPVVNQPKSPGIGWVDPVYVGEVAYREYVPGRWLRHTSWKGLRPAAPREIQLPAALQ